MFSVSASAVRGVPDRHLAMVTWNGAPVSEMIETFILRVSVGGPFKSASSSRSRGVGG
jgi:hypothetical protein